MAVGDVFPRFAAEYICSAHSSNAAPADEDNSFMKTMIAMTAMCFCCCLTTWFLTKHGYLDFEADFGVLGIDGQATSVNSLGRYE